MTTESERNKALVLQLYDEVWNKGNLNFINEVVSPDFIDHPARRSFPVPDRGRESLVEAAQTFRKGFSDLRDDMVQVTAEGDRVAYLGRITGTHDGQFLHVQPTGKKVSVLGIKLFRLEDGKIVERWGIPDVMSVVMQVSPPPAAPGGH